MKRKKENEFSFYALHPDLFLFYRTAVLTARFVPLNPEYPVIRSEKKQGQCEKSRALTNSFVRAYFILLLILQTESWLLAKTSFLKNFAPWRLSAINL